MDNGRWISRFVCSLSFVIACLLGCSALAAETSAGATAAIIPNANGGFSESALGDLAADAVRIRTDADAAVVFSGDLGQYLPSGDVTKDDVEASFPADTLYYSVVLSPAELREVLEYGVTELTLTEAETLDTARSESGHFPQVSGITYRIDASAPAGERILSVQTADGEELELSSGDKTLNTILPEQALSLVDGAGAEAIGGIREIILWYLREASPIAKPELNRIRILGAHSDPLVASGPVILIGIIILICVVMAVPSMLRKKNDPEAREEMYLPGLKRLKNK